MTENESTKANELTGKEKSLANLKPFSELSPEEQKAIRSKGGIARGEQRRKQRTMKEQMLALLNTTASREQAQKYLGADAEKLTEDDMTFQGLMTAKMWQEATQNGNAKAAEFCRDTSGQRPKDLLEVSGNVITDADRALMANLSKRLCKTTEENSPE